MSRVNPQQSLTWVGIVVHHSRGMRPVDGSQPRGGAELLLRWRRWREASVGFAWGRAWGRARRARAAVRSTDARHDRHRSSAAKLGLSNLECTSASRRAAVRRRPFRAVTTRYSAHHFPDPMAVLGAAARGRPGALVAIADMVLPKEQAGPTTACCARSSHVRTLSARNSSRGRRGGMARFALGRLPFSVDWRLMRTRSRPGDAERVRAISEAAALRRSHGRLRRENGASADLPVSIVAGRGS